VLVLTVLSAQLCDLGFEVGEAVESSIDTGEPEVRHFVELAERAKNRQPDPVAWYFSAASSSDAVFDLLTQASQVGFIDGATLACFAHARNHFVAAERLGGAGALEHRQGDLLDSGEPSITLGTLTTPANRGAILSDAAIDNPAVSVPTKRTMHPGRLLSDSDHRKPTQ
jgi:hypothetical protein